MPITNYLEQIKNLLFELSEQPGVSGYEYTISPLIKEKMAKVADTVTGDRFGNLYATKKGEAGKHKIMLAAHMDEIGLMVKEIDERGFLRFTSVGGIDQRTLLAQEVTVHGKKALPGVIGTMPPHLIPAAERENAVPLEKLGIDVGLTAEKIREFVQIGDVVTLKRSCHSLLNNAVSGKALDDRAGIAVMYVCLDELGRIKHNHDVVAVTTTQEEVGLRGAMTSAYTLQPDLAVAIDVTHAVTPDTKHQLNVEMGKGPAIALGPNIHPSVYRHFTDTAGLHRFPYQVEPIPGHSGTDAWAIQVSRSGIPSGLLSIPLRYMHTSVETLDLQDVVNSGKLLAHFIADLPADLEEFLCY